MNSRSNLQDYSTGINVIVGGNSLGRGITFPKLQTMYYCRTVKVPQADTVWQHCRMFGYDRMPGLVRAFMPPRLYRSFCQVSSANNSIFSQVETQGPNLKIYYPKGIKPTRKPVVDQSALSVIAGGVNYFPFAPLNSDISLLDRKLKDFDERPYHTVNPRLISELLNYVSNDDPDEWSNACFSACVDSYCAERRGEQAILIVRRDRDIAKGTGTMLSPNDRVLAQSFRDKIVLVLYKVAGDKGWNGQRLWIPNIKFPEEVNFFHMRK